MVLVKQFLNIGTTLNSFRSSMNLPFLIEILNILDKIRAVLSVTQLNVIFGMLLGTVDFD